MLEGTQVVVGGRAWEWAVGGRALQREFVLAGPGCSHPNLPAFNPL